MDKGEIQRAATLLIQARRGLVMTGLPAECQPASVADAHAIQDAVTAALGRSIGAFKANAPANAEPTRGVIYADTVLASPARLPASRGTECGVEGEVAFVFRRDLPSRATPYTREEVAAAVDACAAIEVVESRYQDLDKASNLEKLADSISNSGFVYGATLADWRGLELGKLKVTLTVNGAPVLDQVGGHPTGDPLGIAVVLVNMMREQDGVRAGQFVTCGSFTGLRLLKPGDVCGVRFEGLGTAEVTFAERPPFRGNAYRHDPALKRWLARSRREQALEPDLPIIDPHHHLWDDDRGPYLLPDILADIGGGHNVRATVFIECRANYRAEGPATMRPVGEAEFVNGISAASASGGYGPTRVAAAIIGHAAVAIGEKVQDVLEAEIAVTGGRLRGIRWSIPYDASEVGRHVSRFVPEGISKQATWRAGFSRLAKLGLTFEGWCYHPQIPEIADLAKAFPDTTIILNHVGGVLGVGPYALRKADEFAAWQRSIRELAKCPNVVVKLGGLGMLIFGFDLHLRGTPPSSELLASTWRPYIETCIEAFGVDRCMYESNFPVDKQSCDYTACWNAFKRLSAGASAQEKTALFSGTAARIYRIPL